MVCDVEKGDSACFKVEENPNTMERKSHRESQNLRVKGRGFIEGIILKFLL